ELGLGSLSVLPTNSDQQLVMDNELPAVPVLARSEGQAGIHGQFPCSALDRVVHRLVRSVRIQVDHTARVGLELGPTHLHTVHQVPSPSRKRRGVLVELLTHLLSKLN